MKLTEEERKRRSEAAKSNPKFGGAVKGSGRPKKDRASKYVADAAKDKAEKILKAIEDGLKADSHSTRLKAALAWLDIEKQEEELRIKEDKIAFESASREQLLEIIEKRFKQLEEAGVKLPFTIEGSAEEIEAEVAQLERSSET